MHGDGTTKCMMCKGGAKKTFCVHNLWMGPMVVVLFDWSFDGIHLMTAGLSV